MPDAATMSVIVGLVGLGLTTFGVAFAVYKWRKKEQPDEDTDSEQLDRLLELEREKLAQRKQEHQWRQFTDVADRVIPFILTDDDEEDY